MLARDLGLERAERDLLSTDPQIEEITARGPPDKILTSRLTDDVPFRSEREDAGISHLPCNAADGACAITRPVFFSSTRSAPGSFCARLLHAFGIALSPLSGNPTQFKIGIGK